ncbi:MAG: ATP-binding protein [Clostridiaceae bacterium]
MGKYNNSPSLRQLVLKLMLCRLFIPLMILELVAIVGYAYLEEEKNNLRQTQITQSIINIMDYHVDQGGKILESLALIAENSNAENLRSFMESSWKSYGYFETLYYLDQHNKVQVLIPSDTRYMGIDMSRMLKIRQPREKKDIIISRPFISLRTGEPTVSLIRYISDGRCIVGELNLGVIQKEVDKINKDSKLGFIFVTDQYGTLLAHPSLDLVKQQANVGNLKVFNSDKNSIVYEDNESKVIGSANKMERTGWVVVNQVSLLTFFSQYIWIVGLTVISLLVCWILLIKNLSKQFKRYIISPLEIFSKLTNELAIGEYKSNKEISLETSSFSELNKLETDFNYMSNKLKVREDSLKESEERYRGLFNRVPIGLFSITLKGEILDINPEAISILRYPNKDELLKINISKLLLIFTLKKIRSVDDIKWDFNNFETQMIRYDGEIVWVRINGRLVFSEKENQLYCEGSIEDINLRKNNEEKIREQQELLFQAEKTQREILEKSLKIKDGFISLISHEFKTPLNVIYSAIQLIETVYEGHISNRVKEVISSIKLNTFRQLKLANNLIDITMLNSEQAEISTKNVNLVKITKTIIRFADEYTKEKNITITFESNIACENIIIDYEKYQRILLNLLSNAVKFTDYGGNISIILNFDVTYNIIEMKVMDTGVGIPRNKQEIIFEQFGQVDNNLNRQAEGLGIGLFLVKLLVNALGGTIKVESELEIGSIFTVILPFRKSEPQYKDVVYSDIEDKLARDIKIEFSDVYL